MPARALIIAIQDYTKVQGASLAGHLPGTLDAGLEFRRWLLDKWKAEGRKSADTEIVFCSEPAQSFGSGASQADLVTALTELKRRGQNKTDELYFFFSGHGFSFVEKPGSRADVIIASDFVNATLSGHCCQNLDDIITWLQRHLGAGRQYYFVDACRNSLDATRIRIAGGLVFDPDVTSEATTFVLQSTVAGATSQVGGPFPTTLMEGLKGAGRAKAWEPNVIDRMVVQYESLRRYLVATLPPRSVASRVTGPQGDGESDAVLNTIKPVPLSKCLVQVRNATAGRPAQLAVTRGRAPAPQVIPFALPQTELKLQADDYFVSVQIASGAVVPAGPVAVDLYSDQTVVFDAGAATPPPPGGPSGPPPVVPPGPTPAAAVDIVMPADGEIKLRNVHTGKEFKTKRPGRLELPHGRYLATLSDRSGAVFKREELELAAGDVRSLDLARWDASTPHRSIAGVLPNYGGGVDFSESLGGPVTDSDLDLWLALLGGGRVLGSRGDYSKLSQFPLHDFHNEPAGASPVYVLAGFEDPGTRLMVGVSVAAHVAWSAATEPPAMPGIREWYHPGAHGTFLVSFQVNDDPPYTIASAAMSNRATLVTLTLDDDESLRINQLLLPLGHLMQLLDPVVRDSLEYRNQLRDVQFMSRAARAFRKRRDLEKALPSSELSELLYTKWLDPVASSLASYELLRRGKSDLRQVVGNMKRFFPDLPDTWALARIAGDREARPHGVPLFLDGLRAFPGFRESLPLPAGNLDFNSPWTAWRMAVPRA